MEGGIGLEKKEYFTELNNLMPLFRERLNAGQKVKFSPRGISMMPMLRQGIDCVILSPVPEKLQKFDLPLYRRDDGKYILHRVVEVGETYTCAGDNQFQLEHGVRHDQMIALVTAFTRGDREISVENPEYKLYCYFWHYSRKLRHFLRRVNNKLRRMLA